MCALRFHKKRIHRQHDEQCCRWILFSRRGLVGIDYALLYIMVWRERGNRPYRRHVSPRTVPAVPYLKGTPPWNTRKHPSLFFAKRGRRKSMHSVIRTPQLLLRTAPASFHTAQPIQSIAPFLCHLHPDCPTKQKKETHHIAIFPTHISFFISLLTHSRIVYQRYHSYCSDSTKRRRKRMDFAGLSSVKYESNLD